MTRPKPNDRDDDAWLARARRGLSPRTADEDRVWAALSQRLVQGEPSEPHRETAPSNAGPNAGAKTLMQRALTAPVVKTLVGTLIVAGIGGVFELMSPAPASPTLQTRTTAQHAEPSPEPVGQEVAEHTKGAESIGRAASMAPPARVQAPAAHTRATGAHGASRHAVRRAPCLEGTPAARVLCTRRARAPAAAAPKSAGPSLRLELDALRAAEHALRVQQPRRSLEILQAFDAREPNSDKLLEERTAVGVRARCALAPPARRSALAQQFVARYPRSAYATRVRASCSERL